MEYEEQISIEVTEKYLNVAEQNLRFPSLVVITGINGAGKTNFFDFIDKKCNAISIQDGSCLTSKLYSSNSLLGGTLGRNTQQMTNMLLDAFQWKVQNKASHNPYQLDFYGKIIENIAKHLNKKLNTLSWIEVQDNYAFVLAHTAAKNESFFGTELSMLFVGYHNLYQDNGVRLFRKNRGENIDCAENDEDFVRKYGPKPWSLVNKAIAIVGLPYTVSFPESPGAIEDFEVGLYDQDTGQKIGFSKLSTGEQTLLRISLSIFNIQLNENEEVPRLLLLDEIDARLHPEMIAKLFDIITSIFIKDYGISVMLTTHSPTTVALADERAIYCIDKSTGLVEKKSKESALRNLLVGIPFIGISYSNRKQIFVESKYDVEFYEAVEKNCIYEKQNSYLYFISSGSEGSGSCTQVKDIVGKLNNSGNNQAFGIIDWDKKNSNQEHIFVLGEKMRYSRENYTFDPLYVGLTIIRENFYSNHEEDWFRDLKLTDIYTAQDGLLQNIYNYVYKKISITLSIEKDTFVKCALYGGKIIQCSHYLMQINGHELAKHYFEQIHHLKRYKAEIAYERDLYAKTFRDFPELVYQDIPDVLENIHRIPVQS